MSRAVRAIVQCRASSIRLPYKALLPIGGLPSVVLCAKRAANAGIEVVVATSVEPSDDAVESVCLEHGIPVVRGSLEKVLERFLSAAADLPDDACVVRLTADNMLPDGAFIAELLSRFEANGLYMGTLSPKDGLPYGLSAEAMLLGALRERAKDPEPMDAEFVTWTVRHDPRADVLTRENLGLPDLSHLRCTIDAPDDFGRVAALFLPGEDPTRVPWRTLVQRLADESGFSERALPASPTPAGWHSKLVLGTVQFGLGYGVANETGMPSEKEVEAILRKAIAAGLTWLDTARAYGESEARLGRLLKGSLRERCQTITKLSPLANLPESSAKAEVEALVRLSLLESLRELERSSLPTLLLHRWSHRTAWGGHAWDALLAARNEGWIGKLGASVSSPEEAIEALADPDVLHLQLPFNLLDWRWRNEAFQSAVAARPDVVIHARSAYLQGLLVSGAEKWPAFEGVDSIAVIDALDRLVAKLGRSSRADLALAYVRSQPWIHGVVVGMETLRQLDDNLTLFQTPLLSQEALKTLENEIPRLPEAFLNPANWPKR